MRSVMRTVILLAITCGSQALSAQTIVELRWDITTGGGTTGSSDLAVQKGDQVSLLVVVKDKSNAGIGLLGAGLSAMYDNKLLEHIRFHECPSPPNAAIGICNDNTGTEFEPYIPGFFLDASAGVVHNFDAYSVKNEAGYSNNNNDEMTLARLNFRILATPAAPTEVVSIFYDAVTGEAISDGNNVLWQPPAAATIRPPPCSGCGCPP